MKTIVQVICSDEVEADWLKLCVKYSMEQFAKDGARPSEFVKGMLIDRAGRALSVIVLDDGKAPS